MQHPPIAALGATRDRVRSGIVISSLAQALEECVANSVDAGATEVHIELDAAAFSFRVADNGRGLAPEALAAVPGRGAAARLRSLAQSQAGTLGCRGEALAALCDAATVEVTSRAAGSFQTWSKVVCGGATAAYGLALEQRPRQGTVVAVRDLFFNTPVKRKALLSAGLPKEVERCREAVFRLALMRPDTTFTLFDKGRKCFLLRLVKGRSLELGLSEVLGHPPQGSLVEVQGAPYRGVSVTGWAVLPPHGHANRSRQFLYVNSRPVKAAALSKTVDALFAQLYKSNARLAAQDQQQAGELQSTWAQGNRHAQFVLCVHCSPAAYDVSFEPDQPEVGFHDEAAVVTAVKQAVLVAWRPTLTLSLLKQLEQLEGGGVEGNSSRQQAQHALPPAAAAAPSSGGSFQEWVASQADAGGTSLAALLERGSQPAAAGRSSGLLAQNAGASGRVVARGGSSGGAAQQQPLPRQRLSVAGVKHTLTSRPVGFGGLDDGSAGFGALDDMAGSRRAAGASGQLAVSQQPAAKRSKGGNEQQQALGWGDSGMAHPRPLGRGQEWWGEQEQAEGTAPFEETSLPSLPSVERLLASWQEGSDGPSQALTNGWLEGGLGQQPREAAAAAAFHDSWRPLDASQLAAISAAAAACTQHAATPHHQPQPVQAAAALTVAEQLLLEAVALTPPAAARVPRPVSAPPQPKSRRRAVHTNPNNSLCQPAAAAAGVGQRGVRGVDTVSGLRLPAAKAVQQQIQWRQEKPVGPLRQRQQQQQQKPVDLEEQEQRQQQPGQAKGQLNGYGLRSASGVQATAPLPAKPSLPSAQPQLPAVAPQLPDFLQPGLPEGLLSSWRGEAGPPPQVGASADAGTVLQLEAVQQGAFAQLKPAQLNRQQLQGGRALCQVDTKFVPIVCGTVLALVDQHAADERVQLEYLRSQLVGPGSQPRKRCTLALSQPQQLLLTQEEVQLLELHGDKLRAWGWEWQHRDDGGEGRRVLTHVPLVLGTALTGTDMRLYLHHLQDTCGAGGLPAGVVRVLNSKACRSAIMFGDELLPAQCQELVDNLKTTQLCFSCAHGRPTTVPLVDLQMLGRALELRATTGALKVLNAGSSAATQPGGLVYRLRRFVHGS